MHSNDAPNARVSRTYAHKSSTQSMHIKHAHMTSTFKKSIYTNHVHLKACTQIILHAHKACTQNMHTKHALKASNFKLFNKLLGRKH